MRWIKNGMAGLATLLLAAGVSQAGQSIDLNEVGAMLVFPSIQASEKSGASDQVETFVTITNTDSSSRVAHVSFINGNSDDTKYCYECNFDVPLSPNDTDTLVFTPNGTWTDIVNEDRNLVKPTSVEVENGHSETIHLQSFGSRTCPMTEGMLVVTLENPGDPGDPSISNVLIGDEVVVNYSRGYAYSVDAISIQGENDSPSYRKYALDGNQYTRLPRVVAANFLAPTVTGTPGAEVVLFTLDFRRQHPPETDCSLTGYDANENAFSNSIIFGCWERIDLCGDLDPEFCYPNLGLTGTHTHGWFALNCEVDKDATDNSDHTDKGNVHGAIIQRAATGTILRKGVDGAAVLTGRAAWARLLFQSITKGDSGTFELESTSPGLD